MLKIKLSELKKLEWNPRTIKKEDLDKLTKSIEKFWVIEWRPFLVSNRTGENIIIWGNQRYEVCKKLGIKEVPVHIMEWLSEEEEKEIIIRDNISNWEWDWDILANEWDKEELEEWGLDTPYLDTENMDDDFSLPDWEKWEIETVTFTLHREQNELLQEAIIISKKQGAFINTWNENWNWNALARIIETYLTQNNEC